MKKSLLLLLTMLAYATTWAQTTVQAPAQTTTNTSYRAPKGNVASMRVAYFLSANEISAAGISPNSLLSSIGFSYSIAPTAIATGNLKIYLQNVADISTDKLNSSTWTTIINGMTLVKDENVTMPTTATVDYTLQNNFRWTGGGLYLAFEFVNDVATPDANATGTLNVNGTTYLKIAPSTNYITLRYGVDVASKTPPTSLGSTTTGSRPVTRIAYTAAPANDLAVNMVYALGQKPIGVHGTEKITAIIENAGSATASNKNVTLTVSGSNSFTNTKQVTLNAAATTIVTFDDYVATNIGTNTVTVTVEADNNTTNDSKAVGQLTNDGIISYVNSGTIGTGTYGATNAGGVYDGMVLNKHKITGTSKVSAVNITIASSATLDGDDVVAYAVILGADGLTTLGRSDDYTILSADKGEKKTFLLQTPVSLTDQEFYVGLAYSKTGATANIYPVKLFAESPVRPGVLFRRTGGLTDNITLTSSTSGILYVEAVLETSSTLPVTIGSFTAKLNGNKVNLNWAVGTENNVNRYEVERSVNGADFVKVATVTANGSANYAAVDASPALGVNYYRLTGVDNDGTISAYKDLQIVKVASLAAKTVSVYPNPVMGNTVNISLSGYAKGAYTYKLTDVVGKTLQQGSFVNGSSANSIVVKGTLAKGIYFINATNGQETVQVKIVKQ